MACPSLRRVYQQSPRSNDAPRLSCAVARPRSITIIRVFTSTQRTKGPKRHVVTNMSSVTLGIGRGC